jgi:predicted ATPase
MLKRLYVDNFRCLVNFELKFDRLGLLMGENGAGKSTVFEVLRRLKSFLMGDANVDESFPGDSLTRWKEDQDGTQRFSLDWEIESQDYSYTLEIQHIHALSTPKTPRGLKMLKSETLHVGKKPVYTFDGTVNMLFADDGKTERYSRIQDRSGISGSVPSQYGGIKLEAVRKAVSKWVVLKMFPMNMSSHSDKDESQLLETGENFPSWYRYVSDEYQGNLWILIEQLKACLHGFDSFSLRQAGESKLLKAMFNTGGKPCEYLFHELSDGQRAMIVLYTIVLGLRGQGYSLFLDEPDNWVSLREIQPWLTMLHDECGKGIEQAVIISHHPEIIDYLGPSMGRWFDRQDDGPVQVSNQVAQDDCELPLSEIIARGWIEK